MSSKDAVELGRLVARLRADRWLTQDRLAELAQCSNGTIARIEQGKAQWASRTARAVFRALAKQSPLLESEALEYFRLTRISPTGRSGSQPNEDFLREVAAGHVVDRERPQSPPGHRAITLSPVLTDQLARLVLAVGEETALTALLSYISVAQRAVAMAKEEHAPPPAPRTLNVLEPPVQKHTGRKPFVEQRIRTVEVFDPAKPARAQAKPIAQPRHRKAE